MNVGDIYRYSSSQHCMHGLAIVRANGEPHDTYWGGFSTSYTSGSIFCDNALFRPEHLEALSDENFIANISELRRSYREECMLYAPNDSVYLPAGGGSEGWFLKAGAIPNIERSLQWKQYELEKAESAMRSAMGSIVRLKNEINSLASAKENA